MRLWSLHPQYLDRQGLLACWRESLLAQKVLRGETRGYTHHPQLLRFRSLAHPSAAIAAYLAVLAEEAERRGYHFDRSRIVSVGIDGQIPVTNSQVLYEWEHLKGKLYKRDMERYQKLLMISFPVVHSLFRVVEGPVEPWERLI
jgi:hypothetical protein